MTDRVKPPATDERAAFEAWFLDYCGTGPQGAVFDQASVGWLKRRADGHYEETRVRDAWSGWQGRAAKAVIDSASHGVPEVGDARQQFEAWSQRRPDGGFTLDRYSDPECTEYIHHITQMAWESWQAAAGVPAVEAPKLAVWFGPMPESNGKTNWTAILHRGDMSEGFTIERSEHHDRVRYEADRVRHLIGELPDAPDILAYDPELRSPDGVPAVAPTARRRATDAEIQEWADRHYLGISSITELRCIFEDAESLHLTSGGQGTAEGQG